MNSVSEISFSTVNPINSYLRATMTQESLNRVMVFHIHKDVTDKLNLTDIGNEFVGQSEHRLVLFSSFPEKRKIRALCICNMHFRGVSEETHDCFTEFNIRF